MSLTVGQLAKLTGLTVRTLHHYDAIGLLVPSQRSESGYRIYSRSDVVRLYRIVALQRLGLSLNDIDAALKSDHNSLAHIVAQQLAELDEQILDATRTRDHLRLIHDRLARGDEPSVNDWLGALELMAIHGKHYSPEEWQSIMTHAQEIKDEWPALVADVRRVVASGAPPESEQARAVARRWIELVKRKAGGDPRLMLKMKDAYEGDAKVRSHTQAQMGFNQAMMDYLTEALRLNYRMLWARHMTNEELSRLDLSDALYRAFTRVIAVAREEILKGTPVQESALVELRREWRALLDQLSGRDARVREKVSRALATDASLQTTWFLDHELLSCLEGR